MPLSLLRVAGPRVIVFGMFSFSGLAVMDVYGLETRSAVMRAVKSKNTQPEMAVRRLLHRAGFRYRLHRRDLPGSPDLVFAARRKVIFVHGCFWHQHPGCPRAARPASNQPYWNAKLSRNVARAAVNVADLQARGWSALVVWECRMKDERALLQELSDFLNG